MIAAENWCVKVEEKVYGPYTTEQLRKYAHEGRLASWSLIAPAGSRAWREASRESVLAAFFGEKVETTKENTGPTFGRRDQGNPAPITPGRQRQAPATSNFVIIFESGEGAAGRLESAIHTLGRAFRIVDNVWSVTCDLTAVGVRNALAPYLAPKEPIFVVDASRGRTSWQNYAPEAHAKISGAYMANLAKAQAS